MPYFGIFLLKLFIKSQPYDILTSLTSRTFLFPSRYDIITSVRQRMPHGLTKFPLFAIFIGLVLRQLNP